MNKPHSRNVESAEHTSDHSIARKAAITAGSLAATGVGVFAASKSGIDPGDLRLAFDSIINGRIAPKVPVYPEAVDGMVVVNERIRDAALPTMVTAAGALAVAKYYSPFSAEYAASKRDYSGTDSFTKNGEVNGRFGVIRKAIAGTGLAVTTVVLTGGSSGVEHEISNGPLRPIEQTIDLLSHNADGPRHIIVQSERNSFMDDSDVSEARLKTLAQRAAKMGVRVVPFNKSLQNIDNRPGLIVTIPNQLFTQATGETIDKNCNSIPILLDQANAKKVGETADINGVTVQVAEKLSDSAQMNRDVAIMAETDFNCIEGQDGKTTFGAIVSGGKPGQAEALFASDKLRHEAAMIPETAFQDNNRDFWRKNGTPLLLQLMGYIGGLSAIAISYVRRGSMERNAQAIATLRSQGVGFQTIKRIESIRAMRDSLKATVLAAPFMPVVAGAFNAAEVGLKVGVGLKELAVGGAITLAANLLGSRRAVKRFENNLDVESALKG